MPSARSGESKLFRPQPISGTSVYLLTGLFSAAVLWASLVEVEVTVRASGVVRPKGETVDLNSELDGIVESVHAVEGDLIQAGDVLVTLENPEHTTETETLEERIVLLLDRLQQIRDQVKDRRVVFRLETQQLRAEIEAERQALDQRSTGHEARRRSSGIRLLRAKNQYTRQRDLLEAGLTSQESHDRAFSELQLAESEATEIDAQEPSDATLEALIRSADLLQAVFEADLRSLEAEAPPVRSELARLRSERDKAWLRERRHTIRSPIDGQITFMPTIHAGEHLAAGTPVATLVPSGTAKVVEALVSNQEVENVRVGQVARLISGESLAVNGSVLSVGPDAIFDEVAGGVFRVVIHPEQDGLRLGTSWEVRLITHTETLLVLLFGRITRSLEGWAGT